MMQFIFIFFHKHPLTIYDMKSMCSYLVSYTEYGALLFPVGIRKVILDSPSKTKSTCMLFPSCSRCKYVYTITRIITRFRVLLIQNKVIRKGERKKKRPFWQKKKINK